MDPHDYFTIPSVLSSESQKSNTFVLAVSLDVAAVFFEPWLSFAKGFRGSLRALIFSFLFSFLISFHLDVGTRLL